MIIVVDSGSTKADWEVIENGISSHIKTMGFNPVFHDEDLIFNEISKSPLAELDVDQVEAIYYYGSGCWDNNLKGKISRALSRLFPTAYIEVEHDLLGAARATCGDDPGISCIMGTGSNSCLYDGKEVIDNVTNLGYLLGDEGSGTHLGKKLIRAYFYRELPQEIQVKMNASFPGGKQHILDHIYGPKTPNVYLASFTKFLHQHYHHPYIQRMVHSSFAEFIDRHVRKYPDHLSIPIHFIGSVAYYFQDAIKIILEERSMRSGLFIKKPIEKLAEYHTHHFKAAEKQKIDEQRN